MCSDKLRDRVAILDLSGPKIYTIFNGNPMDGAVEKILKIKLSRLFKIAILELWFHEKRAQIQSK